MRRCTGVAARWCPIHGDCICRASSVQPDEVDPYPDLVDDACPLHSTRSDHADQLVTS